MGLETGNYISDLDPSNPLSTDAVKQGDDHLRLIKKVLKQTFPNSDRARPEFRTATETANKTLTVADESTLYLVSPASGNVTLTLPDATTCPRAIFGMKKMDTTGRQVIFAGTGGQTIDGQANRAVYGQYEVLFVISNGTNWVRYSDFAGSQANAGAVAVARVCATANVAIATGLENNDTIDGMTLVTGDVVLLTGQTNSAENGLYTVVASGAASRTPPYTVWGNLTGLIVLVKDGDDRDDTVWRSRANLGGTLGTTAILFSQMLTTDDFSDVETDLSRDDYLLGINGSSGATRLVDVGDLPGVRQIHLRDQKSAGSDAGNGSNGMNIRTLNVTVDNSIAGASRSGNQIILPEGTYDIFAIVPCAVQGKNQSTVAQAYLYNVTDANNTIVGTSVRLQDGGDFHEGVVQQGLSHVRGRFSITGTKTFEIRMNMGGSNRGLGRAADVGLTEVYTEVVITKVE